MKKNKIRMQMEKITPDVPIAFHEAMTGTLGLICRQEDAKQNANNQKANQGIFKKRTLAIALAAMMMVAAFAVAAGLHYGLFDTLLGTGREKENAFIQRDLAKVSYGECDVEVKEAAYDGMSLYLVYSVRDRNATEPVGVYDESTKRWWADEKNLPAMERDNIGWWADHIWIDGKCIDMPNMSGGDTVGSDTPGELLFYQMYRLDQEDVYLNGNVEIALPFGKRQKPGSLTINKNNGEANLTHQSMVTFMLDASVRESVVTTHPNEEKDLPYLTARVSEVNYTPLNLYITLDYEVKPEALKAYQDRYGEGVYDENGRLLWKYDRIEIAEQWTMRLELVDGNGKPVYDAPQGFDGFQGGGKDRAWFMYSALSVYPDELFLAPVPGDTADMSLAVRVK